MDTWTGLETQGNPAIKVPGGGGIEVEARDSVAQTNISSVVSTISPDMMLFVAGTCYLKYGG